METTGTQPERDHPKPQITVHEYHNTSLRTRLSEENALRQGYQIANDATSWKQFWRSAAEDHTKAIFETGKGFIFNGVPPSIKSSTQESFQLKEWGSSVTEDEMFTLDDLPEFNPSEFANVSMENTSIQKTPISTSAPSLEMARKRVGDENLSVYPETKRRKLRTGSLFRVIPQPHIHPTTFGMQQRTFKSPFRKAQPKFVAPYTKDTFPKNCRLGWLIPIRGSFPWPWEGCARGEMLEIADSNLPGGQSNADCISWSEETLLKFWNYILELRRSGSLGRLALSFHPAREPKANSQSSKSGLPSDTSKHLIRPTQSTSAFHKIDYFKVYHDASNTMYVRRALDIFSYPHTREDGRIEKIRMLKGVQFALVNEASQGVLIV